MRHSYHKTTCKVCGRKIGANNFRRHERTHMTDAEREADDRQRRMNRLAFDRAYEIAKRDKKP